MTAATVTGISWAQDDTFTTGDSWWERADALSGGSCGRCGSANLSVRQDQNSKTVACRQCGAIVIGQRR